MAWESLHRGLLEEHGEGVIRAGQSEAKEQGGKKKRNPVKIRVVQFVQQCVTPFYYDHESALGGCVAVVVCS